MVFGGGGFFSSFLSMGWGVSTVKASCLALGVGVYLGVGVQWAALFLFADDGLAPICLCLCMLCMLARMGFVRGDEMSLLRLLLLLLCTIFFIPTPFPSHFVWDRDWAFSASCR